MMPGLTKVLQIAEDFSQINVQPGQELSETMKQMSQVFVYDD